MISHIFLLLNCMHLSHCFTINISGENYIEPGVPYNVTCTVSDFLKNRRTGYSAIISSDDITQFVIVHIVTGACVYRAPTDTLCPSSLYSCDKDGLATHWIYNTSTDLDSSVTFRCLSKDNGGQPITSTSFIPTIPDGPGASISFNPTDQSITKNLSGSLGPILCSAQCNPPCQFYWIKPEGTVVDGSNLTIPNLSKNDHGTFKCHTGNGYGNNATKNLLLTVNYGPEFVTLFPSTMAYTITEGDTIPYMTCTASCRPQCTFMWTGPNVPGGTTNDLSLQNINRNQAGTFYCTATNEVGSKMSSSVLVDIKYGPGSSISFDQAGESITKIEGQSLGPIICSAQCNPPCQFYWIKPDGTVVDGSNLAIPNLLKNDHGTFTCHTGNGYGNNETKNLNVTVNYGPESVRLSPPTTTYTVTEGDTIPSVSCTAPCRPQCTFMWTGPNVPGGTTNDLYLQNINRYEKGTFYCTASNEVGSKVSSSVDVDVRCHPRSAIMLDTTIVITNTKRTLNITLPIISYPQPTLIRWTFIQNGTTYLIDVDKKYITTTYGVYQHVSQLIKDGLIESEYGTYSINVSNNIGPYFQHDFKVVEENKPTAPIVFYVVCKTTSAVVLWKSEFKGGITQELYVQYRRTSQSSSSMLSPSIPDTDVTADLQYTVNNLVPETIYIFEIIARNYLGDSLSKPMKCTTDQTQIQKIPASTSQESNTLFTAGISSLIISVLAIVFVIVFVVLCRSRLQKREKMRTNDYTEFTTCTHCNPVVTDSYDSINTTTIGTVDINGTQTDRNVDTYEECLPVTKTNHTYNNLNKPPKEKKKLKKKEEIYDNMKI